MLVFNYLFDKIWHIFPLIASLLFKNWYVKENVSLTSIVMQNVLKLAGNGLQKLCTQDVLENFDSGKFSFEDKLVQGTSVLYMYSCTCM